MREIKFRAWVDGEMHEGVQPLLENPQPTHVMVPVGNLVFIEPTGDKRYWYEVKVDSIMQFTGLHDKNGKEIYEGDIFRVEEDTEDLIYYLVVVWVKEWCMFCTLRVDDEYNGYLNGGIKALDEPSFWTYTLEDTNDRRFFLAGNIYQNANLLQA